MSYNWSNRTILIAEDDEMNFRYLDLIFSKFTNVNVIWAINGQKAIDYAHLNEQIDLVIMDVQLPLVSGLDAIRHIKSFRPSLPIIAHTANAYSEDIARCFEAGCDDYITKPVSFQDLLRRIDGILNHATAA